MYTYNGSLELFHEALVTLDVVVVLVRRHHWDTDCHSPVSLLQRYVDLLLELFHVQTRVMPVLNEGQVHVPDHSLQTL